MGGRRHGHGGAQRLCPAGMEKGRELGQRPQVDPDTPVPIHHLTGDSEGRRRVLGTVGGSSACSGLAGYRQDYEDH